PDATLKAFLTSQISGETRALDINSDSIIVDTNNDGEIQFSEAALVFEIVLSYENVSSLVGIRSFVNLKALYCNGITLTELDLSGLSNLELVVCSNNSLLESINLNGLTNLLELEIRNNIQITNIDFSGLNSLNLILCNGNSLTNLVLNGNQSIETIDFGTNNISTANLTNLPSLSYTSFYDNQITTLSLNNLPNIETLDIGQNQLSGQLDLSNLTSLKYFSCLYNQLSSIVFPDENSLEDLNVAYNNFESLDLTKTPMIDHLSCNDNPQLRFLNLKGIDVVNIYIEIYNNFNLEYACVNDEHVSSFLNRLNYDGIFNCNVNSYCSFTPGGTYYTIEGNNRIDNDANGCDSNDEIFPYLKFEITSVGFSGTMIPNAIENYSIPVLEGMHLVTPVLENPSYFTVSPASVSVSFPSVASPAIQDFCITPNGVHNDVEVIIVPIGVARPGFDADYKIIYKNKGNQVANGSVSFGFDDAIMDLITATPINDGNATNSLSWNYTNLNPFETREIDLVFNINSPMEIPAVNGDDVLDYTATIVGATDETRNDNTFTLNQTVVNSFDPNDKTCLEGTTITPSMVGQYVHYVIRFENTGTFAAQNIVVKDMIDTTKFDIATLVPQRSSHDFVTRITNTNKVEFIFENINLPFDDANNDGYVAFKIKTKPTLVLGDTFSNEASIYFDYNFPIITEPATTTVAALSNQDFDFGSYFTLYPNPAKDVLNFKVKNEIGVKSIQVYNTLGQIVLAVANASTTRSIDVASLNAGAYF
ncbi:MAG TPA: T9SS type A sorting domain-containing protein, partial [Flavobacterium sp.]|nr:T9SS type A sorting domain-containing protein [Flavobacterium sp.]